MPDKQKVNNSFTPQLIKKVNDYLKEVHKYRSVVACSSAIIGIEVFLRDMVIEKYKDMIEQKRTEYLKSLEYNNKNKQGKLLGELENLMKRVSLAPHFILTFVDDDKTDGARSLNALDSEEYIIVLPKSYKEIIINSELNFCDEWSDEIKIAKKNLREKTAHELGHAVNIMFDGNEFQFPEEEDKDEDFANCFANEFLKQSITWKDGIPIHQGN